MRERVSNLYSVIKLAGRIRGRDKVQKMAYILKVQGAPFNEQFQYNLFFPYSFNLKLELDSLVEWGLLKESNKECFQYNPSKKKNRINEEFKKYVGLINYLNKQPRKILEIVSTIFYLHTNYLRTNYYYDNNRKIRNKINILKPELKNKVSKGFEVYKRILNNKF